MCSFCPELMLEGDDVAVFSLFADLCRILVSCGSLSVDESSAALEEHTSFIVEKRRYHSSSGQSAGDIVDVVPYRLRDVGFSSRPHLLRVFKLCCLVSGVSASRYPAVSLDLSGFALSAADFQSCVQLVQSYILSEEYSHQSFFSDQTLKVVKKAIADAGRFFGASNFSMWTEFCGKDVDAFAKYSTLFTTFVAVRRKSFDARYVEYNNANRMSRLSESGDTAGSSGSLSSVIQRKRQDTGPPSVVSVKSGGSKSSNGGTKSGSKSATVSSKGKQQKNIGGNSGDGAGSSKGRKKAVRDADDDGSGSQPKPKKVSKNC